MTNHWPNSQDETPNSLEKYANYNMNFPIQQTQFRSYLELHTQYIRKHIISKEIDDGDVKIERD